MGIESVNNILTPVSTELRQIRSHDENDYWLVQSLGFSGNDYQSATHVLIGCPQDEGVRRNNGRAGAAKAPDQIREQLYKLQVAKDSSVSVYDAGNVITSWSEATSSDQLDEIHAALTRAVSKFLKDGKKVIVLGGGNDISFADARALSEVEDEIAAINIDAHLDMRIADQMTSGTPYRRLIEGGYLDPHHFYEFGIRPESNSSFYLESAKKLGVHIQLLPELIEHEAVPAFKQILDEIAARPLFVGLDMDSIQASEAPGVSASSPIGFSGREVMQFIHHARQKENLRVFELTEVNLDYDIDNRTVKLAAQLVYRFLFG